MDRRATLSSHQGSAIHRNRPSTRNSMTVAESLSTWRQYDQLRPIAAGGCGELLQLRSRQNQQIRALKVALKSSRDATEQIKREFRMLNAVAELPVPRAGILSQCEGRWGFTQEYCEGTDPVETLRSGLSVGQLPNLPRARRILCQMMEALALLHEMDVIHGDIKPANLIVTPQGRVRLLDFGSAMRDLGPTFMTGPQHVRGTFPYQAPEAALYGQQGKPSDIYSLGRTFFMILAGRLPSVDPDNCGNPEEYLVRLASQLPAHTPVDLARWTVQMLQNAPEKRPTARELASAMGWNGKIPQPCLQARWEQSEVDEVHHAAARAMRGGVEVVTLQPGRRLDIARLHKAMEGLSDDLPWLLMDEVDCRRELLPMRAFDGAISGLATWARRLPANLRRAYSLRTNPAVRLVGTLTEPSARPAGVLRGAVELLQLASQDRLLVIPIRNFHCADVLSVEIYSQLRLQFGQRRILLLLTSDRGLREAGDRQFASAQSVRAG